MRRVCKIISDAYPDANMARVVERIPSVFSRNATRYAKVCGCGYGCGCGAAYTLVMCTLLAVEIPWPTGTHYYAYVLCSYVSPWAAFDGRPLVEILKPVERVG